jgi:hypothetical protein
MIVHFLLGLMLSAIANPVFAQQLCPHITEVLNAADEDFMQYKGAATETGKGTQFEGSLSVHSPMKVDGSRCILTVRRYYYDGKELPPSYSCGLADSLTFEQAVAVYEQIAAELKACLPDVAFSDERTGDASKRMETWIVKGAKQDVSVKMELYDAKAIIALLTGTPLNNDPGVVVELAVINNAPLRPGLNIEIPTMKE